MSVVLEEINIGNAPDDMNGDPLRTAMGKVNRNFDALNDALDITFKPIEIPSGVDLNTYTTSGIYHQSTDAGALAGTNYPLPNAGLLEVFSPTAAFVYQFFTQRQDNSGEGKTFWRTFYNTQWSPWSDAASRNTVFPYSAPMADTQDLNAAAYRVRGYWPVVLDSTAAGGTNFPAAEAGVLLVLSAHAPDVTAAITDSVTQVYYAAASNKTYTRSLVANTWTAWSKVMDESLIGAANGAASLGADSKIPRAQLPVLTALLIVAGTDANTVVDPGSYYINDDADATAALNWPELRAGTLVVERAGAGNVQVTQTYTTRSGSGFVSRTYKRVRFGAALGWGGWQEMARAIDAMAHVYLTAATDANSLVADNTWWSWDSAAVMGVNFPPVPTPSAGVMQSQVVSAGLVIQTCVVASGAGKRPVEYRRTGAAAAWSSWRFISPVTDPGDLPTVDCGDVIVDGQGLYQWVDTVYRPALLALPLPTAAHSLDTYTAPGRTYYQGTPGSATVANQYPDGASLGFLEVVNHGGATLQRYANRDSGSRSWWRTQTATGWSSWMEILSVANAGLLLASKVNVIGGKAGQGFVKNDGTNDLKLLWDSPNVYVTVDSTPQGAMWTNGNNPSGTGWMKFANGLIICRGVVSGGGDVPVTFPLAFTQNPTVVISMDGSGALSPTQSLTAIADSLTLSGFLARKRYINDGGGVGFATQAARYIAIGF